MAGWGMAEGWAAAPGWVGERAGAGPKGWTRPPRWQTPRPAGNRCGRPAPVKGYHWEPPGCRGPAGPGNWRLHNVGHIQAETQNRAALRNATRREHNAAPAAHTGGLTPAHGPAIRRDATGVFLSSNQQGERETANDRFGGVGRCDRDSSIAQGTIVVVPCDPTGMSVPNANESAQPAASLALGHQQVSVPKCSRQVRQYLSCIMRTSCTAPPSSYRSNKHCHRPKASRTCDTAPLRERQS